MLRRAEVFPDRKEETEPSNGRGAQDGLKTGNGASKEAGAEAKLQAEVETRIQRGSGTNPGRRRNWITANRTVMFNGRTTSGNEQNEGLCGPR